MACYEKHDEKKIHTHFSSSDISAMSRRHFHHFPATATLIVLSILYPKHTQNWRVHRKACRLLSQPAKQPASQCCTTLYFLSSTRCEHNFSFVNFYHNIINIFLLFVRLFVGSSFLFCCYTSTFDHILKRMIGLCDRNFSFSTIKCGSQHRLSYTHCCVYTRRVNFVLGHFSVQFSIDFDLLFLLSFIILLLL